MKGVVRWGLPILLIGLCLWALDAREIAGRLASADPLWMALGLGALWSQTVLMALRWRLFARYLGVELSVRRALGEYLTGQMLNATLPGGVIGDAARAARSRDGSGGLRGAAQAVVLERAAGQVGLGVVALAGLFVVALMPGALSLPSGLAPAVIAGSAVVAGVLGVAVLRTRLGALLRRCLPSWRVAALQVGLSVGAALLNVAAFVACARATGTSMAVGPALVLVPLILTAMLIPLSVGGWGWREGAAAALFPLMGAAAAAGVAAGIAFGVAILLSTLPAILFALFDGSAVGSVDARAEDGAG
ncbi:MAG: lysylphosphatidylglycerol synthase transmembrane domain-containing protein [Pseudomonadota bacterium]